MNILQFLSHEELRSLRTRSNAIAVWRIAANYALIALGFGIFIVRPNPVTFLLASMIPGGCIPGVAVLNLDAAHVALLTTQTHNCRVAPQPLAAPSLAPY